MSHSQQATAGSRTEPQETAKNDPQLIDGGLRVSGVGRALKGTVVAYSDRGWLRLRWTWGGKRYFLRMGLPDSKVNRVVAERKAKLIERDMLTEQFDDTLAKYQPQDLHEDLITVVDLFEAFIQARSLNCDAKTLDKYWGLLGHLRQGFRQRKACQIGVDDAFEFRDKLLKTLAPITVKERIGLLKACWEWGHRKNHVKVNVWLDVRVKVPPKQRSRPFSKEESRKILSGFREDATYAYYLDFVEFLLSVGCRVGEAIGLKWGHLSEDCSVIWIGESYSRGRQRPTKTNRDRSFELSPRLQAMLLARRPDGWKAVDLVFPSPKGRPIDDQNFLKRAWKPILGRVGVPYRMPRNSRHTFISQAIDDGAKPTGVAEIVGNSAKTIYQNYLGRVSGRAKLPEVLD